MFLTRRSYDAALAAAYEKGREAGERLLAVMREQHSTLLKQLEASLTREREHSLDLATIRSATAFPLAPSFPARETVSPAKRARESMEKQDPFRELPFGDPSGTFESMADAAILPADLMATLTRELGGESNGG